MGKCKVPIIGSGGKSEGLNVWNKYASYTPARTGRVSFSFYGHSGTTTMIKVNVSGNLTLSDITINDLVGKTMLKVLDDSDRNSDRVVFNDTSTLYYYNPSYTVALTFSYTYNKSAGIVNITDLGDGTWFGECFERNKTYQSFSKTVPEIIGSLLGFVVDDDPTAYPDGGTQGGYYYKLLAQVASANVMSLSNNAVATAQQDYRNTIETEVSNANS